MFPNENISITSSMADINYNQNYELIQKQMDEMAKDNELNEQKLIETV